MDTESQLDNSTNNLDKNAIHYLEKNQNTDNNIKIKSSNINNFNYIVVDGYNNKYISPFEKLYDPFENEEDEEEQKKTLDAKNKRKNVCLPIFYNPDLNSNKNNTNNNQYKNSFTEMNINANFINEYLNNLDKEKKIYQIWNGNLQTSRFEIAVKFLTTYPSEIFSKLMNLPENIHLASKTTTKEVVNYIEKNIIKDEKLFLFSWVEIDDEKYIVNKFNFYQIIIILFKLLLKNQKIPFK